jgi:hypothetical protein
VTDNSKSQFQSPPRSGRHLYAVARYDGVSAGIGDSVSQFVLTRGYWDEAEAQAQAGELNKSTPMAESRYFVLPVRVDDT